MWLLSWKFCLVALLLVLFLMWLWKGGKSERFVGLSPLEPTATLSDQLDPATISRLMPGRVLEDAIARSQTVNIVDRESSSPRPRTPLSVKSPRPRTPLSVKSPRIQDMDDVPRQVPVGGVNKTPAIPKELTTSPEIAAEIEQLVSGALKGNKPKYKREKQVAKILQELYGVPFITVRPDWLINPETGCALEIDCYNDELKLGCEIQGESHYVWPSWTGQSYEKFLKVLQKDKFKVDRCDEVGVYLLFVPYNVPTRLLRDYILYYTPEKVLERQRNGIV